MNFSSPDKVRSVVEVMRTAELTRAAQRATLNSFFNGAPLWTEDEAKENRILVRFNDKVGSTLLHTARAQYENGLMGNAAYCRVKIPDAPAEKQGDWGAFITNKINATIAKQKSFFHTQDEVFGGVVLHGVGAKIWWDCYDWCPSFVGIQDILIPTDTDLTMDNLQYFAVRRKMRAGELFKKTIASGDNMDKGWNLQAVKAILDQFKDINQNPHNYDWSNNPEQMTELYKQNMSYYDSDSAPVIWMWDFYYKEEESEATKNGWYKKIVLETDAASGELQSTESPQQFIYESKRPVANELGEIIHFQFGDGNNVPPFKYHSIRSLAFLTYEILWTMNRLRCQWTQHVFEQMLTLFRVSDPNDRARLNQIVMDSPWGIIPDGLNMVTAAERYSVDANLVGSLRSEYQQLLQNSTSTYTQDTSDKSGKERTKFEVQAILAQASALMGSMLRRGVKQEVYAAREICRRFALPETPNFDAKKFRTACIEYGIPEKWLDVSRWEIEIDQKLGGGNRTMEIAEASELMNRVNMFDPEAQAEIKHRWVLAITGNPNLAASMASMDKVPRVTDAVHDAELAFGTLMQGVPVSVKEGLNHIETIETILKLMTLIVKQIQMTGNVGTPQQVIGLQLAAQYVGAHMAILEQDPNERQRVKQYSDVLGKLMNEVKGFAQRQAEQAKAQQPQGDGSVQAKLIEAQANAKIKEAQAQQKLIHKQQAFIQKQKLDNVKTAADIQRTNARAIADTTAQHIRATQVKPTLGE